MILDPVQGTFRDPLQGLPETNVVSFVLRFTYDQSSDGQTGPAAGWHGLVRHVQSDQERRFVRWADAEAFIGQFVELGTGAEPSTQTAGEDSRSPLGGITLGTTGSTA